MADGTPGAEADREAARRFYRRLAFLTPRTLRDRWLLDMEEVLAYRLSKARGRRGRAWVWVAGTWDLLRCALEERLKPASPIGATGVNDPGDGRRSVMGWSSEARQALTSLKSSPVFVLTAVGTLTLGIGAAVATFSLVYAVLLAPLPYDDADRIVAVWPERNFNAAMVRETDLRVDGIRDASGVSFWTLMMREGEVATELTAAVVSPHHFGLLGTRPALGRDFVSDDGLPGRGGVIILSHDLWIRSFGGDPDVIGRTITISGADHERRTVIGVMPEGHRPVMRAPEAWIPIEADPALSIAADDTWWVTERFARLAPGVSLEQAQAQLRAAAQSIKDEAPTMFSQEDVDRATLRPLGGYIAGDLTAPLYTAFGAVALVLLITCANVSNLTLARGEARVRALAVRAALGAARRRIVVLLLFESLFIGVAAATLGTLLSFALLRGLIALAPDTLARLTEARIDTPVLLFALGLALVASLLSGLVPALRGSTVRATAALGGGRAESGRRTGRVTQALVAAQVALAVVVTTGSGLMLRSLTTLLSEDPGLQAEGLLTLRVNPGEDRYPTAEELTLFYESLVDEIGALPGVTGASAIHIVPGRADNWSFPTYPEGHRYAEDENVITTNFRAVLPDYFEVAGIGLLQGRTFSRLDRRDTERVVLVNRAFAERWWPGESPLGRTVRVFSTEAEPYRVVGVVDDVRQFGYDRAPSPELYYLQAQWDWQIGQTLVVRFADGDPMRHAALVQTAVHGVDSQVAISQVESMESVLGTSAATTRFLAFVLTAFGALALALGAVGVFGVTSYAVGRRVPEYGVRIALGASRESVVRVALARAASPIVPGLAVGIGLALAAAGLLEAALYGVDPVDPATLGFVTVLFVAVSALAALVPALRAGGVDPIRVLNRG